MAPVKFVVVFPTPKDTDAFEKRFHEEHVPLAMARLAGETDIIATRIVAAPQGPCPFHRVVEVYFPSMQALEACAASEGGKETLAHAFQISTGGPPLVFVAEEEVWTLGRRATA